MVEVLYLGQLVFLGKLLNQLEQVCQVVLVQTPTVLHLQEEALNVVEILVHHQHRLYDVAC